MSEKDKAKAIILLEKLRLMDSELFRLASRYGVKNVEELDKLVKKGKVSEEQVGEDIFIFDYLMEEKEKAETMLKKLNIKKSNAWQNLQNLLELPKLNFRA